MDTQIEKKLGELSEKVIDASTENPPLVVTPGIGGGTALSMQRRMHDARFATRYFVGTGIDVGAGDDSLGLYVELFPLIKKVVLFDMAQGDAQTLANVPDQSFDFLFSSHCLEHLYDPHAALGNWIRVVKPGGHLIVSVPDEDLYEQGCWPSTFNPDHKVTFTTSKDRSWSPVSVNMLSLISEYDYVAKPLSIMTIDHAYRYKLRGRFPHTLTPLSECAIEFILRKLS